MRLLVKYSPEDDIVLLGTSERGDGCYDVEGHSWTAVTLPLVGGYKPVALEIMFASSIMPLETNCGYCPDTDTLVIGDSKDAATLAEGNGDLTAYWRPEDYDPEEMSLVAVSLRNASKHLAPVIANLPR